MSWGADGPAVIGVAWHEAGILRGEQPIFFLTMSASSLDNHG